MLVQMTADISQTASKKDSYIQYYMWMDRYNFDCNKALQYNTITHFYHFVFFWKNTMADLFQKILFFILI